jgi:hypothetical protein
MTNFWVMSTIILSVLAKKRLYLFKNKIIYNLMIFVGTKNGRTKKFFSLFWCCCWIRDQGSEIREPGWIKIRIRDKHSGSATLVLLEASFMV